YRRAAAPGLDDAPVARGVGCVDLLEEVAVDERTFLQATRHGSLPFPTPHDEATRYFALVARLETLGLLSPWADGRTSARAAAFAAAVRVVDRVHGATALVRLAPHPPTATSLTQNYVLVLGVADATDCSVTLTVQLPQFARRHAHGDVKSVPALDLETGTGRARQLRTLAWNHLDRVDDGADRDEAQRHGVACLGLGLGTADDGRADLDLVGGEDVALLAVDVVQQRDVGAAIGVVLDRCHLGGHAFLLASPEVDDAVPALVTTTAEA